MSEFMAFVVDEISAATVRAWAADRGWDESSVHMGGPDAFSAMLEEQAPPQVVLIDIDGQREPVEICTRLLSLCGPDTRIITIGTTNDIIVYRQMINAGIADYLVKPLSPDLLNQAYATATTVRKPAAGPETKEAKLVFVIGVRGGVGASTLAVNLAWTFANQMNQRTILIDLDLQFGTSALALDVEPGRGLRDVVSSPSRVDSLMISSSMITAGDNLVVMSAEESIDEPVTIDPAALEAVIKEVRGKFDVAVIDVPTHLLASQKKILTLAHKVMLVSEQSLTGIRDTLRIKNALKSLENKIDPTIITARVAKDRGAQVDRATFEKGIQGKIHFTIPEDIKNVNNAANAGKAIAVVAKEAESARAITAIAETVVPRRKSAKSAQKSGGLFGKILKGKS